GENVYPKEVENLLFGHPEVVNAVGAPVPHAGKGFVPAAMVVARDGSTVVGEDLKTYSLAKGPAYSHPRFVDIVAAVPVIGAGRTARRAAAVEVNASHGERRGVEGAPA